VRTVRAERKDVLQEELIVGHAGLRLALSILQADAAEFRRRVVDHQGRALRMECRRIEVSRVGAVIDVSRIEPVVARTDAPIGHELVDALQVPAGLPRRVRRGVGQTQRAIDVISEITAFAAPEVLALQLEVGVQRIAVGRVFPDKIGNGDVARPVECDLRIVAREVELRVLAVLRARLQI
jgi:hypothetical protein